VEKSKRWSRTKFPPEVIERGRAEVARQAGDSSQIGRTVHMGSESWRFDTDPEFYAEYRRSNVDGASYYLTGSDWAFQLYLERSTEADYTSVTVTTPDRESIAAIFNIFEEAAPSARLDDPSPAAPVIFVGHGRSEQWRDLKDHLQDQHGYEVEAYEVGARAGHGIRDILEAMLTRSSFAVLVLTGEDEDTEGRLHARDNVIHETGLFQGRLGWPKAIVLLENGAVEFSNIHGIEQIRFDRGNIRATFGDVLATLRREFGPTE